VQQPPASLASPSVPGRESFTPDPAPPPSGPGCAGYVSRDAHILAKARGRSVLHIGCVGFADADTATRIALARSSLHHALTQVASVTGVDYSQDAIDYFRQHGVFDNVLHGNAEDLAAVGLASTFDVVVAGDVIEHLSNPGRMLDGIRALCHEGTEVIITTPHAFGLPSYLRHARGTFREGAEHVMTFNLQNLRTLLERHGFEVVRAMTCYQNVATRSPWFAMGRRFFERYPRFGGTLLVEARLRRRAST
jgi:hypothetical protein